MNLYGNKPQEQAIQKLIHDTNKFLLDTSFTIGYLKEEVAESMKDKAPINGVALSYLARLERSELTYGKY